MAVKLETKEPEPCLVETTADNLQCCQLFGDEEDSLAIGERQGDQVRDGLRLSCAGRTLDDEVLSFQSVDQCAVLRTVGIVNQRRNSFLLIRCVNQILLGKRRLGVLTALEEVAECEDAR